VRLRTVCLWHSPCRTKIIVNYQEQTARSIVLTATQPLEASANWYIFLAQVKDTQLQRAASYSCDVTHGSRYIVAAVRTSREELICPPLPGEVYRLESAEHTVLSGEKMLQRASPHISCSPEDR
jgi:hypothetical protein